MVTLTKQDMIKQVFINCKRDVNKTIKKLVIIECEMGNISEEDARKKVIELIKKTLGGLK